MIVSSQPVTAGDVALHYDEWDSFYREIWGEHVHHGLWERKGERPEAAVRNLVDRVAQEAGVRPGSRVCDVGCGYGATAGILASEYGAVVTALTLSPAQHRVAAARTAGNPNPRFLLEDWLANSVPDESMDAVLSIESSEHMVDKAAFFREAGRVLVPGGRMIVCAWLAAESASRAQQRFLLEPICREGRLPSMGRRSDYEEWFAAAGLPVERFENLTRRVRKTWPICIRRFAAKLLCHPRYAAFFLRAHARNRIFALTALRIWLAYATGAMHYGIFSASKKDPRPANNSLACGR